MYSSISYEYIFWNDYHNRFSWYPLPRIVGNSIFLVVRTFKTWCCNFQIYIIINFSHHAVHYIPQELSYNRKSVPLTTFTHFTHPQPLPLAKRIFSLYLWAWFFNSTYKWDHIFVFLSDPTFNWCPEYKEMIFMFRSLFKVIIHWFKVNVLQLLFLSESIHFNRYFFTKKCLLYRQNIHEFRQIFAKACCLQLITLSSINLM